MKNRVQLFEENSLLGGYLLAVRDDWSYKIKKVNISKEEKELYLEKFGEKIVTYETFFEWWKSLKK